MGNFKIIENDFIDRTLLLISQYETLKNRYPFEQQYNYTLLLNCLLGIIVLPSERLLSRTLNERITNQLKTEMGLNYTSISTEYVNLRAFIRALRNSIAHFSFEITSNTEEYLIDNIVFKKPRNEGGGTIATFQANELLPFMRYYAGWIRSNIVKYPSTNN